MEFQTIILAFGLTLFAGLSTGIGSALALFTKRTNTKFLSISLGFSAGVMIYVSFVEIFIKGKNILASADVYGERAGTWLTVLSFFGGMAFIAIIDKLVPNVDNPHEMHKVEEIDEHDLKKKKLARMGIFTALAIAIHNFPEGLATFTAALSDSSLGIAIAVAIAIHNIPEGIAVSVPVFYATGNRKKAFWLSFTSGLAEPVGALLGYLILLPFIGESETLMGFIFAAVAGIMVFISLDELLPAAEEYGEHHLSIYGMVGGMAVMAISLLLFI
jgi:ZIP family zinc transporter